MSLKRTTGIVVAGALLFAGAAQAQTSSVQTKQYEDGGFYEGTFTNGLQHGTGTYRLPNGYEYSGAWVDGEIKGHKIAANV